MQLAAQLAAEREAALANPLQFLTSHIEPEVPAQPAKPTPAPAPPPMFRGKVTTGKAKPELAPDDVLSRLAELEADE